MYHFNRAVQTHHNDAYWISDIVAGQRLGFAYTQEMADRIAAALDPDSPDAILNLVKAELATARRLHPEPRHSIHEGWGYAAEEWHEFEHAVWERPTPQSYKEIVAEAVQVMAMLVRLIEECNLLDEPTRPY